MERARELLRSEEGGGARALGGLLLATGVLVLLYRKTSLADPWGSLPVFLIMAATATFLYGTGFAGARLGPRTLTWQRANVIFGLILIPLALYAFVDWVGGNTGAPLNTAWIWLVTAGFGFAAALLADVRAGCLIGGLALIIAWLGLWDALLDSGVGGDIGTLRGLLVVIALILLVIAALVAIRGRPDGGAGDVVTAAGLAAVGAGAISLLALGGALSFFLGGPEVGTSVFWDGWLLAVSLLLLLYGAASGARGPVYIGAPGLFAFISVVGLDADGTPPDGSLVGWPLVLLLIAAALLAMSVRPALRRTPD